MAQTSIVFVIITFIFTIVMAMIQQFTKISFELITLPQLAPAFGYFLTILLFKNTFIPIKIGFNKTILLKAIYCIAIPSILFSLTFFIGKFFGVSVKINNKLPTIIFGLLFGIIIGGIGEEIGWRSFFQPLLERRHSKLISALIVGLVWGLWHVGHYKNGLLFMICFLTFTISASAIIVNLLKDTKYNILLSSVFHISVNTCFIIFFESNLVNLKLFTINAAVWILPAIVTVVLDRKYYFIK